MANVYVYSGAAGTGTGADWTNAFTTLAAGFAGAVAGDTVYVADDHAESQASAMTLTSPGTAASPCRVLCVSRAGSVPPVSADLATTATITTTGANAMNIGGGYAYWYGITFACGTGTSLAQLNVLSATGGHRFKSCEFQSNTTSASATIALGTGGGGQGIFLDFDSCTFGFSHVSQGLAIRCGRVIIRNCATPIKTGGSYVVPTSFIVASNRTGNFRIEGCDLSQLGSGKNIVGANADPCEIWIADCKTNASVNIALTPASPGASETYVSRIDSAATNYVVGKYAYAGSQVAETTLIRTNGASDGTTGFSAKIATTSAAKWQQPFEGIPIAAWNATVGSAITVTLEGLVDAAALPNNDDVWFDVRALGTSGNPLGVFATGTKADILASGSALTASTEAWDSLVTSRANSTAYTLGQTVKVATNSGRVFFCTTAGTSAASEPAGFATAVDGGSVTDGTAVFRAGVRFKKAVSVTPQIAGAIYAIPKAGAASATYYIDPKITLGT